MIIQKLRLQNGWSQQQLAEMSGLSTRTIQRIENGQKPSMESVKSLAAVFEVNFNNLQEALTMNTDINNIQNSANLANSSNSVEQSTESQNHDLSITEAEKNALKRVRKLKKFYVDFMVYFAVIVFLAVINWLTSPSYWWVIWVILGWGLSFAIRGIKLFSPMPLLGANWEKKQVEKQLNRKL